MFPLFGLVGRPRELVA